MKGDLKHEVEVLTVQGIVSEGIEREELRDEIFVQLMRQTNNNPVREASLRLWNLCCLCVIAFHPTKVLQKVNLKQKLIESNMLLNYLPDTEACQYQYFSRPPENLPGNSEELDLISSSAIFCYPLSLAAP